MSVLDDVIDHIHRGGLKAAVSFLTCSLISLSGDYIPCFCSSVPFVSFFSEVRLIARKDSSVNHSVDASILTPVTKFHGFR